MLGNVAPAQCRETLTLALAGRWAEAQAIQTSVLETDWQILTHAAAGLKAALNLLGYEAGRPRLPARACEPQAIEQIRAAMQRAGLIN